MSATGAIPIFIDTGAFYARTDEDDKHYEDAAKIFDGIQSEDLAYRPIYTSQAVLAEFATLALYKLGHETAARALTAIQEANSINIVPVNRGTFDAAIAQFVDYDDQQISFVDHTTSILADDLGVDHIFGFDSDFRTLGFSLVPSPA